MFKLDGEYETNNTRFVKPLKYHKDSLLKRNIVFITSDNLNQNIEALLVENNINTIRLTSYDYKLDNLNFLKEHNFDFIESIDILSDSVTNIDGIYHLKNLKYISSQNHKIDYTRFTTLKIIGIETADKYSIEKLSMLSSLESISIMNKFNETDLRILSKNKNLKQLTIRGSKLKSLKGLENFEQLEILSLFHNRSIKSLEGLNEKHKRLREIHIYSAPKLFDINKHLMNVPQLKFIQLTSKKVDSFAFLDLMKNLEVCGIHNLICNVENGDKTPLIRALKRTNGKIWK
jgi:hypothetical protein